MELADWLIWGGLTVIVIRYLLPRILDWLGISVEKRDRKE
jgi:hypothetical protein